VPAGRNGSDEGEVAVEAGFAVGMAQPRPFDELRRHRIADRCGERGCVLRIALARQFDRLLGRSEIRRQRCRRPVAGGRVNYVPVVHHLGRFLVALRLGRLLVLLAVRRLGLVMFGVGRFLVLFAVRRLRLLVLCRGRILIRGLGPVV
jgi:hypothetical protein